MSTLNPRLELTIDLFELGPQRAQVLPQLATVDLITAILAEFRADLRYLADEPQRYELHTEDGTPLDARLPLGRQLSPRTQLRLVERRPLAARPATSPALLVDEETGRAYRLSWQPALIGRPATGASDNDLLAVNLMSHPRGRRVSRRQARLTESDGVWAIESLSSNPVSLIDSDGRRRPLGLTRRRLQEGERLLFDTSGIQLSVRLGGASASR